MSSKILIIVGLMAVMVIPATAQFDVNGPSAALSIQGKVASTEDPANHDIFIAVPGTMNMHVDTAANPDQGVIMIGSVLQPTPGVLGGLPWGGSLDLGAPAAGTISNAFLIGDGVSLSNNPFLDPFFRSDSAGDFDFDVSLVGSLNGLRFAVQCIVQDPTNPPFLFDNTEVADLNFTQGQQIVVMTGDDGQLELPFLASGGFNFHGANYSSVWIEGNGNINFGGQNVHAAGGFYVEGNNAWVTSLPGIAANRSDFDPAAYLATEGVLFG
ncbi:MAG: hypothetical protein KDB53_07465 [Planctomycetes bacterium]|nr:hypothetical protein [Planctomycetota bacterium]